MAGVKPSHFDVHGQLCILSIDDDEVNLLVIEQLLKPQGWKVRNDLLLARTQQSDNVQKLKTLDSQFLLRLFLQWMGKKALKL
jgi:CheY-like chemotaxis protein